MQWRYNKSENLVWYLKQPWEVVFAWTPVKDELDNVWVWLEAVYRRVDRHGMVIYKRVPNGRD